jgi:hypothetical protein
VGSEFLQCVENIWQKVACPDEKLDIFSILICVSIVGKLNIK